MDIIIIFIFIFITIIIIIIIIITFIMITVINFFTITVIGLKLKVTLERVFGSFVWEYYSRKEQIVLVVTNVSTSW